MLYKAAAQGARKGKRRVGAPENTANPLDAAIAQLVEHLIRNEGVASSILALGSNNAQMPHGCNPGAICAEKANSRNHCISGHSQRNP